jgi:hypothetical protein
MTDQHQAGYEKSDVNILKVTLYTIGIVVFLTVVLVLLDNYFTITKESLYNEVVLKPESIDLRQIRAGEDEILLNYKVLDAEKGVYAIPVSRAMKLIAEEDFRDRRN